jgi:hypothetical protein
MKHLDTCTRCGSTPYRLLKELGVPGLPTPLFESISMLPDVMLHRMQGLVECPRQGKIAQRRVPPTAMTKDDIQLLYEYDHWANNRVLQAVSALSAEEFTRDLGGSFRSVRDTLVHIVGSEYSRFHRVTESCFPDFCQALSDPNSDHRFRP